MDDFEELRAYAADLSGCVQRDGLLHIIHNATNDLSKGTHHWDCEVSRAQQVANLCHRRRTRQRLLATCFGGEIGKTFHDQFKRFKGKCVKHRWGSTADCMVRLLQLMGPLLGGLGQSQVHGW